VATEPGTLTAASTIAAATAAAAASASASPFAINFADYGIASLLALVGIVARHCFDASRAGAFNVKALAFDLPTAPMLGIVTYIGCLYLQIVDPIPVGIIILISFLGPDWLRQFGSGLIQVALKRFDQKPGGS
jgi:hypothetical protein